MTRLALAGPVASECHAASGHPECPARVHAAVAGIESLHLQSDVVWVGEREATHEELCRVHTPDYLGELAATADQAGGYLDGDTYAFAGSWLAAKRACGAGLVTVDALRAGVADVGFVLARPPGHHALPGQAMGFCLLNNIAVAARSITAAGERVAIIDWDVHHGNGTQAIFWDDPQVLYASTHQAPLYPGTGRLLETGGVDAMGTTINVPLPAGATGDVVRLAFDTIFAPAIDRFAPDWVLVSAGYDAHRADPLAELCLSSGDFAALAATGKEFAPRPGRLVFILEGGYNLDAIKRSVAGTVGALVDVTSTGEEQTAGGPGAEAVAQARLVHAEPREHALW